MSTDEDCMKSLQQLIRVMQSIVAIYTTNNGKKSSSSIMIYMKNYEKELITSGKTTFKDHHAELFYQLYMQNRQSFLDICDDSSFISEKKLRIWFGSERAAVRGRNYRLPFGICYEKAKEMHEEASNKLTNEDDDKDADIISSSEYKMYYELCYYILDNIVNALVCKDFTQDLKSLKKSLKELRRAADIDEYNEVPGNSFMGLARNITKMMTGKEQDFDAREIESVVERTNEAISNPVFAEAVPELLGGMDLTPKDGQSFTDVLMSAVQRLGPVIEKVVPMSSEPVPEGVNIEQMAGIMKEAVNVLNNDNVEIIPKDSS